MTPGALPSEHSALALLNGEPGALLDVAGCTALRAGVIFVALSLFGEPRAMRSAVIGAVAIELAVLGIVAGANLNA